MVTVPREDYEALEASLDIAERVALDQERRIAQLEAQLALMRAAVAEALRTLDGEP